MKVIPFVSKSKTNAAKRMERIFITLPGVSFISVLPVAIAGGDATEVSVFFGASRTEKLGESVFQAYVDKFGPEFFGKQVTFKTGVYYGTTRPRSLPHNNAGKSSVPSLQEPIDN